MFYEILDSVMFMVCWYAYPIGYILFRLRFYVYTYSEYQVFEPYTHPEFFTWLWRWYVNTVAYRNMLFNSK